MVYMRLPTTLEYGIGDILSIFSLDVGQESEVNLKQAAKGAEINF